MIYFMTGSIHENSRDTNSLTLKVISAIEVKGYEIQKVSNLGIFAVPLKNINEGANRANLISNIHYDIFIADISDQTASNPEKVTKDSQSKFQFNDMKKKHCEHEVQKTKSKEKKYEEDTRKKTRQGMDNCYKP